MVIEGGSPQAKNQEKFRDRISRWGWISSGNQLFFVKRAYSNKRPIFPHCWRRAKKRVLKFVFSVAQYQDFCNSGRRRFGDGQKTGFLLFPMPGFSGTGDDLGTGKKWKIKKDDFLDFNIFHFEISFALMSLKMSFFCVKKRLKSGSHAEKMTTKKPKNEKCQKCFKSTQFWVILWLFSRCQHRGCWKHRKMAIFWSNRHTHVWNSQFLGPLFVDLLDAKGQFSCFLKKVLFMGETKKKWFFHFFFFW